MRLAAALLILAAVIGFCAWHHATGIEAEIGTSVAAVVAQADLERVGAAVDGRVVTLTGQVPSPARKEFAGRAMADVRGVSRVINLLEVAIEGTASGLDETIPSGGLRGSAAQSEGESEGASVDGAPLGVPPVTSVSEPASSGTAVNQAQSTQGRLSQADCQFAFDKLMTDRKIDFDSSSAEIRPDNAPLLAEVGDLLARCGGLRVEVAGHTDASGPRAENLTLSLQRAESVMAYLVAAGIGPERLTAVGYGPDQPIADNLLVEGRAENRRIGFRVQETP